MNEKTYPDKYDHNQMQRLLKRGLTFIPPVKIVNKTEKKHTEKNILEFTLAEPYSTISRYFLEMKYGEILPVDSESGLFLPRIPVSLRTQKDDLVNIVDKAGVVIPSDGHIITGSREGPEFLFTLFSVACFSLFVKFFHTILRKKKSGSITVRDYDYLDLVRTYEHKYTPALENEPDKYKKSIPLKIISAGKSMISRRLVDSIFGNISSRDGDSIYITEAGSFLDDLKEHIVKVPLNGEIRNEKSPSSEIEVHRNIYKGTDKKTIIHGHPLFTVILSLDCQMNDPNIGKIPVVSDENGPSLDHLVPEMILRNGNVIAKGHGIFCSGNEGFDQPLDRMAEIENYCREEYFKRLL